MKRRGGGIKYNLITVHKSAIYKRFSYELLPADFKYDVNTSRNEHWCLSSSFQKLNGIYESVLKKAAR